MAICQTSGGCPWAVVGYATTFRGQKYAWHMRRQVLQYSPCKAQGRIPSMSTVTKYPQKREFRSICHGMLKSAFGERRQLSLKYQGTFTRLEPTAVDGISLDGFACTRQTLQRVPRGKIYKKYQRYQGYIHLPTPTQVGKHFGTLQTAHLCRFPFLFRLEF